ncbi:VOC family protein [Paenibacillus psychroresistens]|uniref:VOC family protein n=1 Tax=Paenibacillus psychroresistens TaxID=1778678 RepID=A0A6B8RJU4_9BACL|nr:VOC family protein [Paenibacillus psychroresistens]QGQ96097.1 VOC family protein [Paenibacillus psychroresistens]
MQLQSLIEEIHYFRIPVSELEDSVRWYTECLGFKLRRMTEELAVVELNAGPLLILVKADSDSRGHFTRNGEFEFAVGFTSPNIQRLRESLIESGVEVDDMKEEDGHFFFHFFDPSGNKLQAHW